MEYWSNCLFTYYVAKGNTKRSSNKYYLTNINFCVLEKLVSEPVEEPAIILTKYNLLKRTT